MSLQNDWRERFAEIAREYNGSEEKRNWAFQAIGNLLLKSKLLDMAELNEIVPGLTFTEDEMLAPPILEWGCADWIMVADALLNTHTGKHIRSKI